MTKTGHRTVFDYVQLYSTFVPANPGLFSACVKPGKPIHLISIIIAQLFVWA